MTKKSKHEPIKGLLDRDLSIASAKPIIDKYCPYLKELVNYATAALVRCERSTAGKGGTPLSLISLYYHVIQMTDGIEVLISQCCFEATIPLLRSSMEATLSIEYILENDYENRSAVWLVGHYLDRKKFYETLNPSTKRGKEFQKMQSEDKYFVSNTVPMPEPSIIEKEIEQINEMLTRSKFIKIANLFKGKHKIKKWYQLNNGPCNLKKLAIHLHRPLEYEILYRHYSSVTHAQNIERMLQKDNGEIVISPIRSVNEYYEDYCILAGVFLMEATIKLASKFRPGENIPSQIREIVKRHRPEAIIAQK